MLVDNWNTLTDVLVLGVLVTILSFGASSATAAPCEGVASLSLSNMTITSTQNVAAGAFTPPAPNASPIAEPSPYHKLPAFCRVAATLL